MNAQNLATKSLETATRLHRLSESRPRVRPRAWACQLPNREEGLPKGVHPGGQHPTVLRKPQPNPRAFRYWLTGGAVSSLPGWLSLLYTSLFGTQPWPPVFRFRAVHFASRSHGDFSPRARRLAAVLARHRNLFARDHGHEWCRCRAEEARWRRRRRHRLRRR